MAELAQRLGLDLTDAFARHVELLSDLFEGALAAVLQTEAEPQNLFLSGGQGAQDAAQLLF